MRERWRTGAGGAIPLAFAISALGNSAPAQILDMPRNATAVLRETADPAVLSVPMAGFDGTAVPSLTVEGVVTTEIWHIDAAGLSAIQIYLGLRDRLVAEGFEEAFSCATDACGGFDFRFAVDVEPPPAMHVDLGDFIHLSARRGTGETAEHLTLLVSRSDRIGFVQFRHVGPAGTVPAPEIARADAPPVGAVAVTAGPAGPATDIATALERQGRAILPDLTFDTGSAALAPGGYAALAALADYLTVNPTRRIALVGHTDSVGSLEGNIALSRRRAASVLERLVTAHGVPRDRLEAAGMGYLAPLASNLTEAGREANRRVEAIIVSTE